MAPVSQAASAHVRTTSWRHRQRRQCTTRGTHSMCFPYLQNKNDNILATLDEKELDCIVVVLHTTLRGTSVATQFYDQVEM